MAFVWGMEARRRICTGIDARDAEMVVRCLMKARLLRRAPMELCWLLSKRYPGESPRLPPKKLVSCLKVSRGNAFEASERTEI